MKTYLPALLLLAGASAAAAPLSAEHAAALAGRSIRPTARPAPYLSTLTPGNVLFGALAGGSGGQRFISENGLEDPTPQLSRTLAQRLAASHGMQLQDPALAIDGDASAAPAQDSHYLLDVKGSWKYVYIGLDPRHYQAEYGAQAQLANTASKTVVADASCRLETDKKQRPPTYDEMVENKAARLKRAFAALAEACASRLEQELLGKPAGAAPTIAFSPLTVDDPVPNLPAKGQERFRLFLQKPLPRAFAISDNGYSVSVAGTRPDNPALPADPSARALQLCQDYAHRACQLYMVDKQIVYGSH